MKVHAKKKPKKSSSSKSTKDVKNTKTDVVGTAKARSTEKVSGARTHKEALQKLQDKDPEFYEFLQQNDKQLLDFDISDDEMDADLQDDEASEDADLSEHLDKNGDVSSQVLNDDEASEDDDEDGAAEDDDDDDDMDEEFMSDSDMEDQADNLPDDHQKEDAAIPKIQERPHLTYKLINSWRDQMLELAEKGKTNKNKDLKKILNGINDGFRAVIEEFQLKPDQPSSYKIVSRDVFNEFFQLCFTYIPSVWCQYSNSGLNEVTMAKWKLLRSIVRPYLKNMLFLMQNTDNNDLLRVLLKHVTNIVHYYLHMEPLTSKLLKTLIKIWSCKSQTNRILAFICIAKIFRSDIVKFGPIAIQKMHSAYLNNSKIASFTTLAVVNFMQRSYTELCGLGPKVAYRYAFVYIRKLATELRHCIAKPSEENYSNICSWKFIQSLHLWARVIAGLHSKSGLMKTLIYPLLQVLLGSARLVPSIRYVPCRLYCIRIALILAEAADIYVPVLPILLEVFEMIKPLKKHTRQSMKPLHTELILKLTTSQMQESNFKLSIVESTLELVLKTMSLYMGSVAFPELTVLCWNQLIHFQKHCGSRLLNPVRELLKKLREHRAWMENELSKETVDISESNLRNIHNQEIRRSLQAALPLGKYYEAFMAIKKRETEMKENSAVITTENLKEDRQRKKSEAGQKRSQLTTKQPFKKKRKMTKLKPESSNSQVDDSVHDLDLSAWN